MATKQKANHPISLVNNTVFVDELYLYFLLVANSINDHRPQTD
ncbi:hypothetical protein QUF58_03385 [Anaerolineales bacterium HSG24]|nr:hypothetical protein [Anaerolineales bacterium HSG24]